MANSIEEMPVNKDAEIQRLEAELADIRDKKNGGPDDARLTLEERRITVQLEALRGEHQDIT